MRITWNNRSIKYTHSEKNVIFKSLNSAVPLTQGKFIKLFESNFEKYQGKGKAYAVANGSNALDLAAMIINLKKNDEVIVPAHTWCATAISFARFGAKIVWGDIDSETLNISIESIKKNITKKTRAIVVVHLYGLPANIKEIISYAKKKKIIVIEDCAQALGASVNKKKVGSFGDISIFSFHSNKIISTLGEGGMLVVNSKKFNTNIQALRHNGINQFKNRHSYYWKPAMTNIVNVRKGLWPFNFSIGEIQCLLGSMLIKRIDQLNKIRIQRAHKFKNKLKKFRELTFQKVPQKYKHVYHCIVAKYGGKKYKKNKDDFISLLWKKFKIQCIVQNRPLYKYDLFKKNGFKNSNCPKSDVFFDNMISWPFYVWMSDKEFNYMINSTISVLQELRSK